MAKTNREKLASVNARIAKLQAEAVTLAANLGNEVDTSKIVAGRVVDFNYGKAPNLRPLTGQVVGVKASTPGEKGGTLVRVAVGEGFDAQIVTIFPSAVTRVVPTAEEQASADEAALANPATDSAE